MWRFYGLYRAEDRKRGLAVLWRIQGLYRPQPIWRFYGLYRVYMIMIIITKDHYMITNRVSHIYNHYEV